MIYISYALGFVGVVFLILMIVGGLMWMTAAGNDERVNKAKSLITNAVIGMVIVFSAYAITYFVTSRLLPTSEDGGPCAAEETDCAAVCAEGTFPELLCAPSGTSCDCTRFSP